MAMHWGWYVGGGIVAVGVAFGIASVISAQASREPEYQDQRHATLPPATNTDAEIARGVFGTVDRLIGVVSDKVRRDDEARVSNRNAKNEADDDGHTVADNIAAINRKRAA